MTADYEIRLAAFEWLNQQEAVREDVLSRTMLKKGLPYKQQHITLLGVKGYMETPDDGISDLHYHGC